MIVVGTDFSEDSLVALQVAEQLSETLTTHVSIVHVRPHADSVVPASAEAWLRRARLNLSDIVIRTGTAWLELLRYAEENHAQLICIAAHGSSGYQALTAGSNARRLLLRSSIPVVVAPAVAAKLKTPMETQQ